MVIGAYLILTKNRVLLREISLLWGIIFLLVVSPWYILAELRNLGYLGYFLFEENCVRYTTQHFQRNKPWHYFFEVLAIGFLPWTVLVPSVLKLLWEAIKETRFLFLSLGWLYPFCSSVFQAPNCPATSYPYSPR
jgi:4-amino-4-deoxy-L-arabinose transferase-like glycosyltransferase